MLDIAFKAFGHTFISYVHIQAKFCLKSHFESYPRLFHRFFVECLLLRATFRDISNFCSTLFPDFILCFHMMKNYIFIIKNPSTEVSGLKKAPKWIFEKKILIYRCDGPKKSLLVKNLQFLSYPDETWSEWSLHLFAM